jgi:hypothetical protein
MCSIFFLMSPSHCIIYPDEPFSAIFSTILTLLDLY